MAVKLLDKLLKGAFSSLVLVYTAQGNYVSCHVQTKRIRMLVVLFGNMKSKNLSTEHTYLMPLECFTSGNNGNYN